jgi:hypothetical protein
LKAQTAQVELQAEQAAQRDYQARTDAALTSARAAAIEEGAKRDAQAKKDAAQIQTLVAQVKTGKAIIASRDLAGVFNAASTLANGGGDQASESAGKVAAIAIPGPTVAYDESVIAKYDADAAIAYRDVFQHWAQCVTEYDGAYYAQHPGEKP